MWKLLFVVFLLGFGRCDDKPPRFPLTCKTQVLRGELGTSQLVPADWCDNVDPEAVGEINFVNSVYTRIKSRAVNFSWEREGTIRIDFNDLHLGPEEGYYQIQTLTEDFYGAYEARIFTKLLVNADHGDVRVYAESGEVSALCTRANCAYEFELGGNVVLEVQNPERGHFKEWVSDLTAGGSSDCSGSNPTIVLSVNSSTHCTAIFEPSVAPEYTFTLDIRGQGNGNVSISRNGQQIADCTSGVCVQTLSAGDVIQLAPSANVRWDGEHAYLCEPLSFVLTQNVHCTAIFDLGCNDVIRAPEFELWQDGIKIEPSNDLLEVSSLAPVEIRVINVDSAQESIYHWADATTSIRSWNRLRGDLIDICADLREYSVIALRVTACGQQAITHFRLHCL